MRETPVAGRAARPFGCSSPVPLAPRPGQRIGLLWKLDVDTDIIFRVADTLAAVRDQIVAPAAIPAPRAERRLLGGLLRRFRDTR
ncbi:hypothetical protein OHA72_34425 [Dactylosporangium sp. NBC_01737]|uniref:hypothetical protein n=1 Tax=Dactylosporangium sp. NBC_01737 TaxID=2975959 RepID=UPI002E139736|nr:hypothetical protein OHA72_34425 [Dactylosporangium sp. NBC_01737]